MSEYDYWDLQSGEGISDYELHNRYDEMLDEVYGVVSIAGLDGYTTSSLLKDADPIAYRCGFSDWIDSELGETITEDEPTDEDGE